MYAMVSVLAKDLTKRALTVSREVISFGKTALLVSPRYTRNTRPRGRSKVFEGVLTIGKLSFMALFLE